MNLAIAIAGGQQETQRGGSVHHHHHYGDCKEDSGPQPPKRNKFLDFLTAPLQVLGKGGNNNDKQYDKYLAAHQGGNCLKG